MAMARENGAGAGRWPLRLELADRTGEIGFEPVLNAFARDELLCRRAGASGAALLHLWRHPRAFVLGLRDSRLPAADEAQRWLHELGYSTAVRNSGGAAVPLDLGVLNVSLVLPKEQGALDFRDDFRIMAEMLADCFGGGAGADGAETGTGAGEGAAARRQTGERAPEGNAARPAAAGAEPDSGGDTKAGGEQRGTVAGLVQSGEIAGSYCPGEFDLSIGGRKFCGIAQRRHANAVVVQAFVVVERTGAERAALARAFYERAAAGQGGDYPRVRPETMGSLSELLGAEMTAEQAAAAIVVYAKARSAVAVPRQDGLPSGDDIAGKAAELLVRYARRG
jgi:octanoyl-[GcvH]:protein N-octanoyltransferase